MYAWETALTMRDTNRVVRPVEWGFEWIADFARSRGLMPQLSIEDDPAAAEAAMQTLNRAIIAESDTFYGYRTPTDFRLEERPPLLFPTNVRPETLRKEARLRAAAEAGKIKQVQFLRFTSPVSTPFPENDLVNARWYPAPAEKQRGKPKQAMIVMPQWNADAFSHNALCSLFNRFGISALRLSKPYHDIRRPAELERSDYAVSSNIGRTIAAVRQAVVDIRSCLDWLEQQGYEQFGILGTSLGSAYAFIATAHDPRIQVCAFNHASMSFADVTWTGQSTRHIRAALEQAGMTQQRLSEAWGRSQPILVHRTICGPLPQGANGLRFVRPYVSAGVFAGGPTQFPGIRRGLRVEGAAMRPLHHRGDALQVHRRLVSGLVRLSGVQGADDKAAQSRHTRTV